MSPTAQRYGYSTAEMLAIDKAVIDACTERGSEVKVDDNLAVERVIEQRADLFKPKFELSTPRAIATQVLEQLSENKVGTRLTTAAPKPSMRTSGGAHGGSKSSHTAALKASCFGAKAS